MAASHGWKALGWLALALLGGCTGVWGAKDEGPSTAKFRTQMEFIPQATLVKEDTTPVWPLGRYAFARGADRLVVITRIGSWAPLNLKDKDQQVRDRTLERVWITIPLDVPVGQEVKLEKLDERFLIGYDAGQAGGDMFIQPYRPLGTITLLEDNGSEMVAALDIVVQPDSMPPWRIKEVVAMPIAPEGLHATMTSDPTARPARPTPTLPAPLAVGPAPATAPHLQRTPAGTSPATAAARSIEGKWVGEIPNYHLQFQFDAEGTFIYASSRYGGDYPPLIKAGDWKMAGEHAVLYVKKFTEVKMDHMARLTKPYIVLRTAWVNSQLQITGDLQDREGVQTIVLSPSTFPDMRFVSPPRGNQTKPPER